MHPFRPGVSYNVTTSTSSAQGNAVSAGIVLLRLVASVTTYVRVGTNPTAVTGDTMLAANWPTFIKVAPGEIVAGIAGGAGILNITECN